MMQFGRKLDTPLERETYEAVNQRFFQGASFYRTDGEVRPVAVKLRDSNPFADGDTAKVIKFWNGERWVGRGKGISVRMDGIDTPESNVSGNGKLRGQVKWIMRYLDDEHSISSGDRGALRDLVQSRIVYLGKLSGAVTNAFGEHFADIGIRLAPAYTLRAKHPNECDTLDPWDKYGRLIGRILAGGENQGEDLLAGFLETQLPSAMRAAETEYRSSYEGILRKHRRVLGRWKSEKPELYSIFGLEDTPKPSEIYSETNCGRMAGMWADFCAANPQAKNDLQTFMAFIGAAPPYPKYKGHLTELDMSAELYSLGGVPEVSSGHGLTSDPMFRYVRPIIHDNYPSPVFARYGTQITNIGGDLANLNPPDCRDGSCAVPE
ncbi:MAG: hypothetical protein HN337_08815 [Deltaproteobacteria bacterium]|nr:hypothetical protein [Deltaproteobacteria bacterium]